MKSPVMEDTPTTVDLPNPNPTPEPIETDEHGYKPAYGNILSLFSTPFLRGQLDLDTDVVAEDCRKLVSQVAERVGDNPNHEYTTYFDEDLRMAMNDMGWFKDFSNIIKDSYVTFVANMFQHPVSHLERDDIHLFAWINRYTGPHQHEAHNHVNCLMSGTYYVKTSEENPQPIKFWSPVHGLLSNHQSVERPQERDGFPNMMFDGVQGSDSTMSYFPQESEFLLWPSYILHSVPPVQSIVGDDYERISISFNLKHRLELDNTTTGDNMSYSFMEEDISDDK